MKQITLVIFTTLLSLQSYAAPIPLKTVPEKGSVEFLAVGRPSALKVHGTTKAAEGAFELEDNKLTGTARIALDGFDTKIETRNQHMKEKYLETAKFPQAELTFKSFVVPEATLPIVRGTAGNGTKASEIPFVATLKLHGVEKEVKGTADLTAAPDGTLANAKFSLNLKEFAIEIPKYLGITIAENVDVTVVTTLGKPTQTSNLAEKK